MKLLIVEDEARLAQTLKRGLEKRGYAVDTLGDGAEAQKRIVLYQNEYDLIILDLMLPGHSGLEICMQARQEGVTTPILILTARSETENKIELLNSGADDYMIKPFSFGELEARIAALLRRPQETLSPELTSPEGDITLNRRAHAAVVHGKELPLTLKEFMLLEYFLRHPGHVVSRDELLEHAWDFDFPAFSNVVDVHVKNLRKKLEAAKANAAIETVRGVGYRFMG